jgi:microsomal dipeptidase-like Zn-dependent dipeptidase
MNRRIPSMSLVFALASFAHACSGEPETPETALEQASVHAPSLMSATLAPAPKANGKPKSKAITGGYVLTHEHPTNGMAFGGNYAFAGDSGNYKNGVMEKGYTGECGGCKAGKKCDHGEVKGSFTGAAGALGADMGDHSPHMGPVHDSNSHLRYSTEWIKEAYSPSDPKLRDSTLKIMVAFAVESEAMCEQLYDANKGNGGPGGDGFACSHGDSVKSIDRQIVALKNWAKANSSWMQIAYSAGDARRIVESGKLAIVLGVESDYAFGAENRDFDPVGRLDHYYDLGVRTFYMAHKVNSRLAGADIYRHEDEVGGKIIRATQAMAGCFYVDDSISQFRLKNGDGHSFCDNKCGNGGFKGGKITDKCVMRYGELSELNYLDYFLGHGDDWFNGFAVYPKPKGFTGAAGSRTEKGVERNNLGLSHDGERVVREAMLRGMIVNIDHVSSRSRTGIDAISKEFGGYPLNALHNNPNAMMVANTHGEHKTPGPNEYDFDDGELEIIKRTGGFFGVRLGPLDAKDYKPSGVTKNCPTTATESAKILAYLLDEGIDVGYSLDYATITEGVHSRTLAGCGRELGGSTDPLHKYGKHITEGLSHIGMMTQWHKELEAVGLAAKYRTKLENDGPEAFVKMWERAEAKSKNGKQIPRQDFDTQAPADAKNHGELCTADSQCKSDRCAWGMCADKDECRDDGDCSQSEYCGDPIGSKRSCKALKAKGDACTKASQCATDRCSVFKCAASDACNSNSQCGSGEYCGDPIAGKRTCKDLRAKGEGCMQKHQCKSNQCSWGKCK